MDLPHLRYVTQAGGRLDPERRAAVRGAGPAERVGALRHVRADRGHGPDGVPAARTWPRPARRASASRSPAGPSASTRRPDARARRRRAGLPRAERDARLCRGAGGPRPRPHGRRAAHRRPGPAWDGRPVRDRRAARPVPEDRGLRVDPGQVERAIVREPRRGHALPAPTTSSSSSSRPSAPHGAGHGVHSRGVRAAVTCRPRRDRCRAPTAAERQARPRRHAAIARGRRASRQQLATSVPLNGDRSRGVLAALRDRFGRDGIADDDSSPASAGIPCRTSRSRSALRGSSVACPTPGTRCPSAPARGPRHRRPGDHAPGRRWPDADRRDERRAARRRDRAHRGTHIGNLRAGGAHVLMAVAGFNFARFRLTSAPRGERLGSAAAGGAARIVIPAMAWVGAVMLVADQYELRHLLLMNALCNDELWGNLWFIELLVYIVLAMAALLAVPAADRASGDGRSASPWRSSVWPALPVRGDRRRHPLHDAGPLAVRHWLGGEPGRSRTWQRASSLGSRSSPSPATSTPGRTERDDPRRAGAPVDRVPTDPHPGPGGSASGVLAGASLYIYLVHWEVWPLFDGWYGLPSLVASLLAGIALWVVATRGPRLVAGAWRSARGWSSAGSEVFRRSPEGTPR